MGFEPTVGKPDTRSPGVPVRPLQHLSALCKDLTSISFLKSNCLTIIRNFYVYQLSSFINKVHMVIRRPVAYQVHNLVICSNLSWFTSFLPSYYSDPWKIFTRWWAVFPPFPVPPLSGEGGIRTHEAFLPTAFRERHHKPLGHLSTIAEQIIPYRTFLAG